MLFKKTTPKFFTAVMIMMITSWVLLPCKLVGKSQRFGEHTASIFMAEVKMLGSGGIYISLKEWKAEGVGQ
jgi:hypothetical protein